jgi:diguanylate cyclase
LSPFLYALIWILPSVVVGVAVGAYLGRGLRTVKEQKLAEKQQERILKALLALLRSTEKLTTDVDSHNHDLQDVGRTVSDLVVGDNLDAVQGELLSQIAIVLESNRQLKDDLVCTQYRLEQQAEELDRTRKEARTDVLSGIANRKAFEDRLSFMLSRFNREKQPFVLALADVDKFKWVNDTHGHQAGDLVVEHIGRILSECVRSRDYVARFGGDEFALILSDIDELTAWKIADRIRIILERHNYDCGADSEAVAVTFSVGLSGVREGDTRESIIARADQALYDAKDRGRNQTRLFDESECELLESSV